MQKSKILRTCRVRLGLLWVPENDEPRDSGSSMGQQPKHLRDLPKTELTSVPSFVDHRHSPYCDTFCFPSKCQKGPTTWPGVSPKCS